MEVKHKGYTVVQDPGNHHTAIFNQNGHMVFHAQTDKEKTIEELKETVDFYLLISQTMVEKK